MHTLKVDGHTGLLGTLKYNARTWKTRLLGDAGISGHRFFSAYLFKYKRRSDQTYQDCGAGWDDAEHALFHCITYMEVRAQLQQKIRTLLEIETLVKAILRGPETWDEIECYFRHVITKKREKKVEMQLITNHGPMVLKEKEIDAQSFE